MDQLFLTIKQLPKVLQNEIWEYVRGDRDHWRKVYCEQVVEHPRFESSKSRSVPRITLPVPSWITPEFTAMLRRTLIRGNEEHWNKKITQIEQRSTESFQRFLMDNCLTRTIKTKLPQVLQNEIWEYVHGDREHWRKFFQQKVIGHWIHPPEGIIFYHPEMLRMQRHNRPGDYWNFCDPNEPHPWVESTFKIKNTAKPKKVRLLGKKKFHQQRRVTSQQKRTRPRTKD